MWQYKLCIECLSFFSFSQFEDPDAPCMEIIFWLSEEYSSQLHSSPCHWSCGSPGDCQSQWLSWPLTQTYCTVRKFAFKTLITNAPPSPHSRSFFTSDTRQMDLIANSIWTSATHTHHVGIQCYICILYTNFISWRWWTNCCMLLVILFSTKKMKRLLKNIIFHLFKKINIF